MRTSAANLSVAIPIWVVLVIGVGFVAVNQPGEAGFNWPLVILAVIVSSILTTTIEKVEDDE